MLDGPRVLDRFLGQAAAADRLRAAIDLAFLRDEPLEPTLIVAPSGAGGSFLARIVAAELASPIVTIDVGGFESVAGQVADFADGLTRHDVLIVTNIERAHMRQAKELAGLIRRGCVVASCHEPPIQPGLKIGVPAVSIVATTTSRPSPKNQLLRMFPRTVCLEPYDAKTMRRILRGAAKRMRAGATRGALDWLAGSCERRPGAAVELLATASDLACPWRCWRPPARRPSASSSACASTAWISPHRPCTACLDTTAYGSEMN